jgi:hydroxymethylpyrimidine pyrophosphatase-like HAD family hydrolase
LIFNGCSIVSHKNELLTLKGLGDEQVEMNKQVEEQNQRFERMLEEQKAGTLNLYLSKGKIVRTFGEPIYVKNVTQDDQDLELWMYRYATQFFGSEKVYLYFDSNEHLVKSEFIKENNGEIREETKEEVGL